MNRTEKTELIGGLKDRFTRMSSAVFVSFEGMNVAAVTKLRNEFRKSGVDYRVVKNTLARKALGEGPAAAALGKTLTGMTGIAWSYEDPSAAAKVVTAFKKDNDKLKIKAGLVEGQVFDAKAVEDQLATMPGKNELRGMLLATMQAPLQNFVVQLNAPLQNLAYLLAAKRRQDGGGEGEGEAAGG